MQTGMPLTQPHFADDLSQHFERYFTVQKCADAAAKERTYKLRYQVFCHEMGYALPHDADRESDEFDQRAEHVLLTHRASDTEAGCVRLIHPLLDQPGPRLPFESYALPVFDHSELDLRKLAPERCCELSRLAVCARFRRRIGEYANPAGVPPLSNQDIDRASSQPRSMRQFPFIAFSLYQATIALVMESGYEHVFLGVEPRLARHLALFGIHLRQVSKIFEQYGSRALFHTDRSQLLEDIESWSAPLQALYQVIAARMVRV
jgi:N-acyl amino acid synthase of PEP-CTERM/exosortase system